MTGELASFQEYQLAFTAHLRDPQQHAKPRHVSARGMRVYKEIVFNNLFESVSACFPVAQGVLGKRAWQRLVRNFFREHSASTPIFRKIPEEFLNFLSQISTQAQRKLPPYLFELCHYEWVELYLTALPDASQVASTNHAPIYAYSPAVNTLEVNAHSLLNDIPIMNRAALRLSYDYAVHKISAKYRPKVKESTQLLVYRIEDFSIKFMLLNPITYQLIEMLQAEVKTGSDVLHNIAQLSPSFTTEIWMQFGVQTLMQLWNEGVIIGVKPVKNK